MEPGGGWVVLVQLVNLCVRSADGPKTLTSRAEDAYNFPTEAEAEAACSYFRSRHYGGKPLVRTAWVEPYY